MRGFEYFVNLLYTIPMTLKKKQKIYKRDNTAILKYKQCCVMHIPNRWWFLKAQQ